MRALPLALLLAALPRPGHAIEGKVMGCGCRCPGARSTFVIPPPCSEAACMRACGISSAVGGGGGGGGGYSSNAAVGAAMGQMIGQAIVAGFQQSAARQRALAEQARIQELQRQEMLRQQELERRRVFEGAKNQLLERMGGGSGKLGFKDDSDGPPPSDLRLGNLHGVEAGSRREALERLKGKPEEAWCKLHLPQAIRLPTRPIHDIGGQYSGMLTKFRSDRRQWDEKCGGPSSSGPTQLDGELERMIRAESEEKPSRVKQDEEPRTPGKLAFKSDDDPPARRAAPAAFKEEEPSVGGMRFKDDDPPAPPPKREMTPVEGPRGPSIPPEEARVPLTPFEQNQAGLGPDYKDAPPAGQAAVPPSRIETPAAPAPAPAPGAGIPVSKEAPTLLASRSAPYTPPAMALPAEVPAADPDAFEYVRRAAGFVAERGAERTKDTLKKVGRRAVAAEFAPAKILINMYDLPETILPEVLKASKGELSLEEANLAPFKAVNVLYNFGAAPNQVLAKILEKKDALTGFFAYGADQAADKLSAAAGRGIADLAGKLHADVKYPRIENAPGTSARVQNMLNEGREYLTKKDVRRASVEAGEWAKEAAAAHKSIFAPESTP